MINVCYLEPTPAQSLRTLIRYFALSKNQQLCASKYRLVLPSKEKLRVELERRPILQPHDTAHNVRLFLLLRRRQGLDDCNFDKHSDAPAKFHPAAISKSSPHQDFP